MQLGMVVKSRAGHDKNGWFVVVGLEGEFVLIADGKRRPLIRPKRKKQKHLAVTNTVLEPSAYETDRALRQQLWVFNTPTAKEG